jgi:DNA-binding IclR family transcriptional regulator
MSSLERGLEVLAAIADGGPARVEQLASRLGMPLSTTYRYVSSLRTLGFLTDDDGTYLAGPQVVHIARSLDVDASLAHLASPALRDLSDECSESTVLCTMTSAAVSFVAIREAREEWAVPRDEVERVRLDEGAPGQMLRDVRSTHGTPLGTPLCSGSSGAVTLLMAPVWADDQAIAAIGLAARTARLHPSRRMGHIANRLQHHAAALTALLSSTSQAWAGGLSA